MLGPRSIRSPTWTSTVSPPIQAPARVDDSGVHEDLLEPREVAVHVADRDDSRRRRRGRGEADGESDGEEHPKAPPASER